MTKLMFADECFDIFVTQDVMEHIPDPQSAFREIERAFCWWCSYIYSSNLSVLKNKSTYRIRREKFKKYFASHLSWKSNQRAGILGYL